MTNNQSLTQPLRIIDNFLWNAPLLSNELGQFRLQSPDFMDQAKAELRARGVNLNQPQWDALDRSLAYRLTLIWGPPGTGKSQTLRAILEALYISALLMHQPLRILVGASNYNAFDNVLEKAADWIMNSDLNPKPNIYRLRSPYQQAYSGSGNVIDTRNDPNTQLVRELDRRLTQKEGITIVGSTPEGVMKLITKGDDSISPIADYFDFVIIDEASQIDVGHTLPYICAASNNAQIILAGDPMQLDPIHKIPAPEGAEYMVGSVYTYIKGRFTSSFPTDAEKTLEINYRSSDEIVSYGRRLCYTNSYRSNSPQLRLDFQNNSASQPESWPNNLAWSSNWATILDPQTPVVCFSYSEGRSGQSNRFESQAIASLIWLLWCFEPQRKLLNENGGANNINGPHTFETFWKDGVGVVTPHSAQRAQIITDLKVAFGTNGSQGNLIRNAVDTVERFQGQQRDVMIASFAVGDPDLVAQEEEFLLKLNRFNVMASRPRAKLIVFVTDEILDHLSSDLDVLSGSRAIKIFAGEFCRDPRPFTLPWIDRNGVLQVREGILRSNP